MGYLVQIGFTIFYVIFYYCFKKQDFILDFFLQMGTV